MPRCKKGDLAIVTGGSENRGRIVTCLELVDKIPGCKPFQPGPYWRVDTDMRWVNNLTETVTMRPYISDVILTPLTGDMLTEEISEEFPITEKELV